MPLLLGKAAATLAKKKVAETGFKAIAGDVLRGGKGFVGGARDAQKSAKATVKKKVGKYLPTGAAPAPPDTANLARGMSSGTVTRGPRNVKNAKKRR